MKKILLLSFYFEPCTLTPSQRISYWAKNFHRLGYYPTIITREWKADIKSHFDTKRAIGEQVRYEKYETYEVYYLPFRPGILDKAYVKWGETSLRPFFLLVKLLDVLLVSFTLRFTSYANFFPFLKKLAQNENYEVLIISGEPFYLFKIGYLASKELKIKWIADYRDDWSTNELQRQKGGGFFREQIFKLESIYEKSWVKMAEYVISVSQPYTQRISEFVQRPGLTIENGFEEEILDLPDQPLFQDFTIVYSGTLYPSQDAKVIFETLKLAKKKGHPFKLVFLGAGFDIKEKRRILKMIDPEIKELVQITERLPRNEALSFIKKSHAVLGIAYGGFKGIPSSKLYEYIGLKKPVILCPTDEDIMEQILDQVGLGYYANGSHKCFAHIYRLMTLYDSGNWDRSIAGLEPQLSIFSRFHQFQKITSLIHD